RSDLNQAREDSQLTRKDAEIAREEARKAKEEVRKAKEEAQKAKEEAQKAKEEALKAQADALAQEWELLHRNAMHTRQQRSAVNSESPQGSAPPSFGANQQTPEQNSAPPPSGTNQQTRPAPSGIDQRTPPRNSPPLTSAAAPTLPGQPPSAQTPPITPHAQPRTSSSPRHGSRKYDNLLKQTALNSLSSNDKRSWKLHMRTCFLRITGQSTVNGFAGYSPIDDQTVNNFGEGRGQGPDGVNARRLYFGTGWRRAAWNQQIVASIAETVVTEADGLQPMLSIDVVKAAIWDYVTQAQASWTAPKPR
ncbi:hypothetical protein GGU11DRAFT_761684, partial [Lentinula aff. detonsa]